MECIFCQITSKQIPADLVWEDDKIVVLKDINPKAPVHLLVIPKEHIASVKDLKDEHRDIVTAMIFTARDVASSEGLAGYKLVFNVGREGGQLIDHLHLHLLGGWSKNDEPEKLTGV